MRRHGQPFVPNGMSRDFSSMFEGVDIPPIEGPPTIWPLSDIDFQGDLSIAHLNSLIHGDAEASQRPALWPLQDEGENNMASASQNGDVVRHGAKVKVADLYKTDVESSHTESSSRRTEQRSSISQPQGQLDDDLAAQCSVLMTAELLELILSFLPGPDLWNATHVSRTWHELVTRSPTLRRVLGFTSCSQPQTPQRDYSKQCNFVINPILASLNLIRQDEAPTWTLRADFSFPARWRTVKAPWRELQICEPPIQRVFLTSSWLDKYIECETGITAGMIADRVELSRKGGLRSFHCG